MMKMRRLQGSPHRNSYSNGRAAPGAVMPVVGVGASLLIPRAEGYGHGSGIT